MLLLFYSKVASGRSLLLGMAWLGMTLMACQSMAPANEAQSAKPAMDQERVAPPRSTYALGRLDDQDIRQVITEALKQKVNRQHELTSGESEMVSLGDPETFEFTTIKMLAGGIELADGSKEAADTLQLEVRGWYREEQTGGDPPVPARCKSFDLLVTIVHDQALWRLKDGEDLRFNREDSEDCY